MDYGSLESKKNMNFFSPPRTNFLNRGEILYASFILFPAQREVTYKIHCVYTCIEHTHTYIDDGSFTLID